MRLDKRIFDKAGVTGELEVQAQGKTLVPVIMVRGLSPEILMTAMASRIETSIQFPGHMREYLACAASTAGYSCSPNDAAGQKLAADLLTARGVTVRASVFMEGMIPLPAQENSLDLARTTDALARLRTLGPPPVASPLTGTLSQSPAGLMAMADKALKAAGYQNGIASLQSLLAKYREK